MRIKFVRDYKLNRRGQTAEVSQKEALGLIHRGAAILSKDLTSDDYKTLDEEQANGQPAKLRPDKRR